MNLALTLTKWLAPAAALFALACALLAPVEAGSAGARVRRAQDNRVQEGEPRAELPADSVVRGRVVYDDTTRPVRRARVLLMLDGGGRGEYTALTDSRGDFQIRGVRAGTYYAFVDLPGVLSPVGFMNLDEVRTGPAVPDLAEGRKYFDRVDVDGKQDASVTVHARRGAIISGRVSYADGDPAVNVGISLMRRGPNGRLQRFLAGGNAVSIAGLRTDDRGMFRLAGLPPGEYVVGVSEEANHSGVETGGGGGEDFPAALRGMLGQQFLMTFYPSAASAKEATPVKVEVGDERADVDITIPERALRTINGVVRSRRGGRPVANARVIIMRRDEAPSAIMAAAALYDAFEFTQNSTTADEQGRWHFLEIPDGPYTINVKPPEEYEVGEAYASMNSNATTNANASVYSPPRRKRGYAPVRRDLEVSGDVSEFIVEVADGARITGTISVEGGATLRYAHVGAVRVEGGVPVPEDGSARSSFSEGTRFNVEGLSAGQYFLQPSVGGSETTLYLKSVTWNGKDLLREPLELAEGATAEGVRVVFASNPATLRVTARAAEGKSPARDTYVYLVPADISQWSPHVRPVFCATGVSGNCTVTAPPGEYRVVALRRLTLAPAVYEQEVRRRAATAPRVTLRAGETGQVEVEAPDN